jgi:Tol biopolymer transport system component
MILPMEVSGPGWKAGTPERLLSGIAQRPAAVFSPDGRWVAYTSNESGRSEVRASVSGARHAVADLDVRRVGSDVVPTR